MPNGRKERERPRRTWKEDSEVPVLKYLVRERRRRRRRRRSVLIMLCNNQPGGFDKSLKCGNFYINPD